MYENVLTSERYSLTSQLTSRVTFVRGPGQTTAEHTPNTTHCCPDNTYDGSTALVWAVVV